MQPTDTAPFLELQNTWTFLRNPERVLEIELSDALAFAQEGAFFSYKFKKHLWDGKVRFYNRVSHKFLAGLTPLVAEEFKLRIVDFRSRPEHGVSLMPLKGVTLRDYQKKSVEDCIKATRGIVCIGTGGGKTEIQCCLAETLHVKTLVVVPRVELLNQTKARFEERLSQSIGIIGSGRWEPQKITISTIQSLTSKKRVNEKNEFIKGLDCVILDETHLGTADTWTRFMLQCNSYYRFGFSGTPLVDDEIKDTKLIGILGPIISNVSSAELIDAGYLTKPTIRFITYPQEKTTLLRYDEAYEMGIVTCQARNAKIIGLAGKHKESSVLILVQRIDHGNLLQRLLKDEAGITAPFMSGKEDAGLRKETFKQFRDGKIKVLIGSTIYDIGVDFPNLRVLIQAGAMKAFVANVQRIGRTLRTSEGKTEALIYDFWDDGNDYLRRHSKQRKTIYKEQGFEVVEEEGMDL